MESYNNALLIGVQLTDSSWAVLKEKLVEQRPAAEEAEAKERMGRLRIAEQKQKESATHDADTQAAWKEERTPVRELLSQYADELINNIWAGGQSVDNTSAPRFAAELLVHVRKRFASDLHRELEAESAGTTLDWDPLPIRKLVLDDMKWVFDNKVRPHVERQDLFRCAVCDESNHLKGFEAVVQHYGAKHTNTFSDGKTVINWQGAEWPKEPPFSMDLEKRFRTYSRHGQAQLAAGRPVYVPTGPDGLPVAITPGPHSGPYPPPYHLAPTSPSSVPQTFRPPSYPQPQHLGPWPTPHQYSPPPGAWIPPPVHGQGYQPYPLYDSQLTKIAQIAREAWDATNGTPGIPPNVRLALVVGRVDAQFRSTFRTEPTPDLLADALNSSPLMLPLKDVDHLACKACHAPTEDGLHPQGFSVRSAEGHGYNFLSLLQHFKNVHLPKQGLDWKEDMIDLPDPRALANFLNSPHLTATVKSMIAERFPAVRAMVQDSYSRARRTTPLQDVCSGHFSYSLAYLLTDGL